MQFLLLNSVNAHPKKKKPYKWTHKRTATFTHQSSIPTVRILPEEEEEEESDWSAGSVRSKAAVSKISELAQNLNARTRVRVRLWAAESMNALWIIKPQTKGVWHCGIAIYNKRYLKAKEEWRKLKYFTMQKYNLQKIL